MIHFPFSLRRRLERFFCVMKWEIPSQTDIPAVWRCAVTRRATPLWAVFRLKLILPQWFQVRCHLPMKKRRWRRRQSVREAMPIFSLWGQIWRLSEHISTTVHPIRFITKQRRERHPDRRWRRQNMKWWLMRTKWSRRIIFQRRWGTLTLQRYGIRKRWIIMVTWKKYVWTHRRRILICQMRRHFQIISGHCIQDLTVRSSIIDGQHRLTSMEKKTKSGRFWKTDIPFLRGTWYIMNLMVKTRRIPWQILECSKASKWRNGVHRVPSWHYGFPMNMEW